jgi:hypothetical protein
MFRRVFALLPTAFVLLLVPATALAQGNTAMLNGVVTDESKSVLPGVTVTATDLSTGRPYQSLTDERGEYRMLNMAPGRYKVQSELAGFATAVYPDVELIVGQNVTLPFTMKLATIEESVTVSGQSPIVDTQSAAVAGYVDRRQMESMPLSGRNWLELSMLVKGVTGNNVTNAPGVETPDQFQVSLDGQQVTQRIGTVGYGGQGKVSRDAVAEFQIITNQFDITQGRSLGMQVQAVTKGGTNRFSGSAYGSPHMHLRGKAMRWFVTFPDGRTQTLLNIPNYDFNWQLFCELKEPLAVPAGSTITNLAQYDNSPKNRYNPAPDRPVFWSEQSWDEMYTPSIMYTVDSENPRARTRPR